MHCSLESMYDPLSMYLSSLFPLLIMLSAFNAASSFFVVQAAAVFKGQGHVPMAVPLPHIIHSQHKPARKIRQKCTSHHSMKRGMGVGSSSSSNKSSRGAAAAAASLVIGGATTKRVWHQADMVEVAPALLQQLRMMLKKKVRYSFHYFHFIC